jgi:hypothetical protein
VVVATKARPIFRSYRLNSPQAIRTGWSITPSTFCRVTATFANSSGLSAGTACRTPPGNGIEAPIVHSERLIGDGHEMFEQAAKPGGKGMSRKMLGRLAVHDAALFPPAAPTKHRLKWSNPSNELLVAETLAAQR